MLKLNCLGSGSSGNCYLLSDEKDRTLILDCGIGAKEIKVALNFDLSKVAGIAVTHFHQDHVKALKDFENIGCEILAPYVKGNIRENKLMYPYHVQAFLLPHGETTSYGFLIRHAETRETLLYATDFEYIAYTFNACKVNYYLIECNYQPEYVDYDAPNKEHKISGHCALNTCKEFLKVNANAHTHSVILCHLGQGSTNPKECVTEVKSIVGDNVSVDYARANTIYELGVKENADIH